MRIFIAGFQHETNTFAPTLADWAAFNAGHTFPAYRRGQAVLTSFSGVNLPVSGFMAEAAQRGWELVPSVWAGATPSSYVTREAFERIAGDICDDLAAALPVDAVYVDLHGAAVAEHVHDTEGELLARLRSLVGEEIPIVASLDLHANVTERMLRVADALVSYRTYPHVDMADTGRLAAQLLHRRVERGSREALVYRRIPYLIPLNSQSTWMQPAKGIYEQLVALDQQHGSILSFCMGFPAADFDECAPMVWGYGEQAEVAVNELYALASPPQQWNPDVLPVQEAVALALERAALSDRPIIIADTQDNPGAGGDSNTTGVIHELLRQGAGERFPGRVAVGLMFDPQAAAAATQLGVGGWYEGSVGKAVPTFTGQLSDAPVSAKFFVRSLHHGQATLTGPMLTHAKIALGACAVLEIQGVLIAVASGKKQMLDRGLFSMLGIEPEQMKIIVVKSSNHFRADFSPLVADPQRDIVVAKAAGPMAADPADLPWKKLPAHISAKLPQ